MPTSAARVVAASVSGASWTVSVLPLGHPALSHPATVTAYVECLSGVSGAVETQRERTVSESPSPPISDILASPCLPDETSVGYGFDFGSASADLEFVGVEPLIIVPTITDWSFFVINHDTVAHPATFYVECLTSNVTILKVPGHLGSGTISATVTENYPQVDGGPVPAGATGSLQQPCPSGSILAGGTIEYASGGSGNLYLLHASTGGWLGAVYALPGSTGLSLLEEAICLSIS